VSGAPPEPRALLRELFAAGVAAVDGGAAVRRAVRRAGGGVEIVGTPARFLLDPERAHVLAAGKAALAMARAWHAHAGVPRAGLAIAREPGELPAPWRVRVGGHPLPTDTSAQAGRAALAFAAAVPADAELVVLLSGGASSLMSAPLPGLTLAELRETTSLLLRSGAEIGELNGVRKHLTAVSGGRLAEAMGARAAVVLVLSDVIGDDFGTIASGPLAPDPTTFAGAIATLRKRGCWASVAAAVRTHLERGAAGEIPETPKPSAQLFERTRHLVVANNERALDAVAERARSWDLHLVREPRPIRGEARDIGARIAAELLDPHTPKQESPQRRLWIFGGETTVSVRGDGRGGRCQELALAAALKLAGERRMTLLAAGTDGSDGPTPAAGAFADGATIARGSAAGVDAEQALARNDSYGFFAREGGLFVTGPTGTNALDVVMVLVEPHS